MRTIAKFALGALLGVTLVLTNAVAAQAEKGDNCLLIVCVDAPILGPIVGGIGDGLEDVLSPSTTVPVQPAPVPQPAPAEPVQPAPAPVQPAPVPQPAAPGGGSTLPESENTVEEPTVGILEPTFSTPFPTPTTSPAPLPFNLTDDDPSILPSEEAFSYLSHLTPFIVGSLVVLLIALVVAGAMRLGKRRRFEGTHSVSVLPRKVRRRMGS